MTQSIAGPITGVYCAATTPVIAQGEVCLDLFAAHCRALIEEGAHGIALLGTTGEANSYSDDERRALLESALQAGIGGKQLLPGTSNCSVPGTIALTRHAVQNEVRACVLLPPFYYKGVSDEGLFRFYASVIDGVNDDRLKVILYHIPQVSQIPLSHDLIERLISNYPDTIIGIKDSAGDIDNMIAMIRRFSNFSVLAGADPLLKPLLEAGGAGCITATSNLRSDALRVVYDNWQNPAAAELVAAAQTRIEAWRELTNSYVQLPTVKAMVAKARGDLNWLNTRPPLVELSAEECAAVWARMQSLDQVT